MKRILILSLLFTLSIGYSIAQCSTRYYVTGGGSVCPGVNPTAIGMSQAQSGHTYRLYRGGSTLVSTITATNNLAFSFGVFTTAGTYTVKATSPSGCVTNMQNSVSVSYKTPGTLVITPSNTPPSVCLGSSITLTTTGGTGTHTWTSNQGGSWIGSSQTFAPTVTTIYTVSANEAICNQPRTASIQVTVTPLVTQVSTPAGTSARCQGAGTDSYTATANNVSQYNWSLTPASAGTISAGAVVTWNASFFGTATVTVTAVGCNSSTTSSRQVIVGQVPVSTTVTGNIRFGPGELTLQGGGAPAGGTYNWYNVSMGLITTALTYPTSATTSTSNFMSVQSVGAEGCTGPVVPIDLIVYPRPVITASQNYILKGANVTLLASAGYEQYTWQNSAGGTIGTGQSLVTNIPDTYKVTVLKTGITDISDSFVLSSQLGNQSVNLVATYTPQIENLTNSDVLENLPTQQVSQSIAYFDGLGRPVQNVSMQASPGGLDLVVPVTYDQFGREARKYLPVVSENNGRYKSSILDGSGNYTVTTYNNPTGNIAADSYPFEVTVYENSPLNRPLKKGSPGSVWQPNNPGGDIYSTSDKTIKSRYELNAANEVLLFTYEGTTGLVSASTGSGPRYYSPNQLNAQRTLDEHNNEVIEYVDKEGRTVCKKVQYKSEGSTKLFASTYYIYDDFGNLVVVLPPEAVKNIPLQN